MLKLIKISVVIITVLLGMTVYTSAQENHAGAGKKSPPLVFPANARGENVMVSLTPPVNVKRIKLYEKTPNVITFSENELNPMEPTLDLYIPNSDRATGAGADLPGWRV
jgi:hypothetical protein